MARVSSAGGHDGGGAEEGAGHQRPPGEDEEEPGGDREGPAAAPGRGREPGPEGRQEGAAEAGDQGTLTPTTCKLKSSTSYISQNAPCLSYPLTES